MDEPTPPLVDRRREPLRIDPVARLAARMAHHFDNALMMVEEDARGLLGQIEDEGLKEDVLELRDICRRATGLTSQLLAGGESRWTEPRVVDLRELVAGLDLGALFSGNVVFCTDFTTSPCRVWADPGHLEEMTFALVLNARETVGSRGTVRLAVEHLSGTNVKGETGAGWVQLEVAESGEGTAVRVWFPSVREETALGPFQTSEAH